MPLYNLPQQDAELRARLGKPGLDIDADLVLVDPVSATDLDGGRIKVEYTQDAGVEAEEWFIVTGLDPTSASRSEIVSYARQAATDATGEGVARFYGTAFHEDDAAATVADWTIDSRIGADGAGEGLLQVRLGGSESKIEIKQDTPSNVLGDAFATHRLVGIHPQEPLAVADVTLLARSDYGGNTYTEMIAVTSDTAGDVTASAGFMVGGNDAMLGVFANTTAHIMLSPCATPPSTPDTGMVSIYAKADNRLHIKDDTGAEATVGSFGVSYALTRNNFF
jgi:hypothetical protein